MKNIAKRALGLTSALFFVGAMALVASPVQAADVDTRITALERELAQLKQSQEVANEERALAAEAKMPSFSYAAGKGLTIAAADNNWSINFGQRLQIYTSYWLSDDNPAKGYNHGSIRVRRFRPSINVTSQQGFYEVKWTFNGNTGVAFDGDIYLHFEKMNPFLPTLGYGYNPSFSGNKVQSYGRTEDSPMINALGMGGSQDGSVVLAWKKLPMMGGVKITHLELAFGHDELDEYGRSPATSSSSSAQVWEPASCRPLTAEEIAASTSPNCNIAGTGGTDDGITVAAAHVEKVTPTAGLDTDGKSMGFALGIQPLAGAGTQGGLNVGSLTYNLGYERLRDSYPEGPGKIYGATTQERVTLLNVGAVQGDHDYTVHGVTWAPISWLGLGINYATYKATEEGAATATNKLNEFRAAAVVWIWGPKNGALSGSKSEGGISISPLYTVVNAKTLKGAKADAEVKNNGVAVVYNAPGGWFQLHGVWDNLGCSGVDCDANIADVADAGKESFNVFTLIAEYRF